MLTISSITYHLGNRSLFENASLHIKNNDKIGLIGLNGVGKSTLLRVIVGQFKPNQGVVSKSKDCKIGFLDQDALSLESDSSILEIAMSAFSTLLEMQTKINKLLVELEERYTDKLLQQLTNLQEQFELQGGYTMQAKAGEVLEGIGFKTSDLDRPLSTFSGGWRMRVILAKLLLEQPSLLLLDEPTNHLDLPSIIWLEQYLRQYDGAVMIVSHDQQFINNTVNRVVEISGGIFHDYAGDYAFYLEEKAIRQEIQANAYENQQQKIKQTERFIERFRAKASKAKQVQSRVKALERMDRVEAIDSAAAEIHFKFNFSKPSGKYVIRLENISKAYGDLTLFKDTSIHVERGDKIALIGPNGKGKSTLLRILNGTEQFEGLRQPGHNLEIASFAQHQLEALTLSNEIIQELVQLGTSRTELEIRTLLGCFLFSKDDVHKKIKVLSGGEKSRVALAKTLLTNANFLLLDEPTNHLDIPSIEILIQALQNYAGSLLIISHNRYFIRNVANKIWYIQDQQIKEYPGTYDEYEYWKNKQEQNKQPKQAAQSTPKPQKKSNKPTRSPQQKKISQLKKKLALLEEQIATLEKDEKLIHEQMALPENFNDHEKLQALESRLKSFIQEKDTLQAQWEDYYMQLEEINE